MSDQVDLVLVGVGSNPEYWWDTSGWYWSMGLHGLFWLPLIGLIVVTAIVLIRPSIGAAGEREISARALLDARYARGEIDRREYLEWKRGLS